METRQRRLIPGFARDRGVSMTMMVLALPLVLLIQPTIAFNISFAFSPTDTMPLTGRAKLLMFLQSRVSIIALTGLAGGAINMLGGPS